MKPEKPFNMDVSSPSRHTMIWDDYEKDRLPSEYGEDIEEAKRCQVMSLEEGKAS